jgi:hypothetical protein
LGVGPPWSLRTCLLPIMQCHDTALERRCALHLIPPSRRAGALPPPHSHIWGRRGASTPAPRARGRTASTQSAWPTDPACGRWENAAAESKQITGWFRSTSSTHWHFFQESTSRGMQCADSVAAPAVRTGICFRKAPVAACSAQTQSQHRRYAVQCPRGVSAGSWRQLKTYASQPKC